MSSSTAPSTHAFHPAYVVAGAVFLPNHHLTPGHAFAGVTATTVCVSGYSSRVRDLTTSEGRYVFAAYGIPYAQHSNYELDHLVSLELGGDNTVANLWPEPLDGTGGAHVKDKLENKLHALVCAGAMPLVTAQRLIAGNWSTAWQRYGNATVPAPATHAPPKPAPTTHRALAPAPTTHRAPAPIVTTVNDHGGATALCNDGTLSFSQHHRGTCSHHHGVAVWYH